MNLQTDIFGRYFTLTDNFTDGLNPSVFDSTCHNDDECTDGYLRSVFQTLTDNFTDGMYLSVCHTITDGINPSIYFKRETFFWRAISVCKTISKCFFYVVDRYSDGRWYYQQTESRRTYFVGEDVGQ